MIIISRYYAILKPMKARYICTLCRAKKIVLLLWLASFFLALPIVRGQVNNVFRCLGHCHLSPVYLGQRVLEL